MDISISELKEKKNLLVYGVFKLLNYLRFQNYFRENQNSVSRYSELGLDDD